MKIDSALLAALSTFIAALSALSAAFSAFPTATSAFWAESSAFLAAASARLAVDSTLFIYVSDKRHTSLAGTYLAACTVYAALYRKSPVGLTYTAELGREMATFLQTSAWDAVQTYFQSSPPLAGGV